MGINPDSGENYIFKGSYPHLMDEKRRVSIPVVAVGRINMRFHKAAHPRPTKYYTVVIKPGKYKVELFTPSGARSLWQKEIEIVEEKEESRATSSTATTSDG